MWCTERLRMSIKCLCFSFIYLDIYFQDQNYLLDFCYDFSFLATFQSADSTQPLQLGPATRSHFSLQRFSCKLKCHLIAPTFISVSHLQSLVWSHTWLVTFFWLLTFLDLSEAGSEGHKGKSYDCGMPQPLLMRTDFQVPE